VIWHRVPAERETYRYFRSRCYAEGLSKAQVTANVGVSDGLSAERRYATRTLPAGVARGLGEFLRGRPAGAGRAGAIAAGLAATTAGYLAGTVQARAGAWRAPAPPAPDGHGS
jgi:hypothetical protein